MPPIDYPPVQQALDALREFSADPEIQRLAAVRERVLREQYWEPWRAGGRASRGLRPRRSPGHHPGTTHTR